ncbi:MAG: glycosyltransferase family 2 protein [Acidobacteria bacterium]|nr:glycosyltransferase family 2 protein [Acidobacteriota bacterium]
MSTEGRGAGPAAGGTAGPQVSLVIPVYNEIECLPALLEEIRVALEPGGTSYEVVLVDDGSSDGSSEWLDRAAAADPRLVVVHFVRNAGQSAAFAAGFRRARGEVVVTLDADGQNPPAEVPKLLAALTGGVDIVAGYRATRRDSAWRRVQSRIANAVRNGLSGETIRDTGCSLKAFRRRFLVDLPVFNGMHRFLPTLCRLAGATTVVEVPVEHRPRQGGASKYGMLNRAWRAFVDLLGVRWLQRRWIRYEVRA